MRPTGPRPIAALLLSLAALLLALGLAELLCRFTQPALSTPALTFVDGVLRYKPGQRGQNAKRDKANAGAPFAINAKGWNSGHADYPAQRGPELRICVVGGALAAALEVPPMASLAENLERELERLPGGAEVFRFGMEDAPLSQHLLMARKAALPLKPNILVVLLAPGDIAASRQPGGPLGEHFQKLLFDSAGMVEELPPTPYAPSAAERLRQWSALARRVYRPKVHLSPAPDARFEAWAHAPAAQTTPQAPDEAQELDRRTARYLLGRLQAEAVAAGARLLVVMDGAHAELEAGAPLFELDRALAANRLAGEEARLLGVAFVDLHPVLAEDFRRHGSSFGGAPGAKRQDGRHDDRWNAYAHAVAAKAVAESLYRLGWLHPQAQR